jgi:hypothetical protein
MYLTNIIKLKTHIFHTGEARYIYSKLKEYMLVQLTENWSTVHTCRCAATEECRKVPIFIAGQADN